jgi:hypothetical protein
VNPGREAQEKASSALLLELEARLSEPHRKANLQRATEWVREIVLEPDDANIRAASKALISLCKGQKYFDSKLEGTDINENTPHSLDVEDVIKATSNIENGYQIKTCKAGNPQTATESAKVTEPTSSGKANPSISRI